MAAATRLPEDYGVNSARLSRRYTLRSTLERLVIYLKRRADLSRTQFFDWWLGPHRALAEQLPGLRHDIISLAADDQDGPFDGLAELWFGDLAAAEAAFASAAGHAASADAAAHVVRRERLYLTEHTILATPRHRASNSPLASSASPR